MKATKANIGKLLDQPDPDIRFYLFWGPDEGQSRAQATRLLQALGADRFIVISNAIKTDPALARRRSRGNGAVRRPAGDLDRARGRGDQGRHRGTARGARDRKPGGRDCRRCRPPTELIKIAETSPGAVAIASYAPEGVDAERMVIDVGRRFGLTIDRPVASRIAASCGNDQAIVAQELEKLSLYLDSSTSRPKELDHDAVDAVGADLGDSDLLHLSDLALSGEVEAVAEGLGSMLGSGQAIPVLRAVQRRLLMLAPAVARVERGERPDAVMASMGKSLFWKDKARFGAMLRRWRAGDVARLSERAAKAERALLFGSAPEQEVLGEELLAVARAARRR